VTTLTGPAIQLGNDNMPIGSHVCAIGNSFGLGNSISCGVVSARNRQNIGFNDIEDFIQTDAAINPGGSGGALIDSDGRLVGLINGIFTKDADIDAGVNFAISLSLIADSLAQMRESGVSFTETK
jgi:S1-C subfamily serine protease